MKIAFPGNRERKQSSRVGSWEVRAGSRSWVSVSSSSSRPQPELLDLYTVNLHRIEKDVQRCDRSYWYFTAANLEKLRNIMCRCLWLVAGGGYRDEEIGCAGEGAVRGLEMRRTETEG